VAKKLPQEKTLELNVSYRNCKKMSSTSTILIMCNQKKRKKNLILATTYESHDNSNLMKYKNTATNIVE
jgi:superfamily I DNA/RNA helicase